jgi:cell division septum initiation protein DivIVA
MKLTHVRIGKLVSGPGYNNQTCAIEAQLDEGDVFDVVCDELRREIDGQIRQGEERSRLRQTLDELRADVRYLEDKRDSLNREISDNRKIIGAHAELEELARKNGLDAKGLLDDIPF